MLFTDNVTKPKSWDWRPKLWFPMLERVVSVALAVSLSVGPLTIDAFGESNGAPSLRTETTIRAQVQEVRLGFYVSSRNGRPVTGLKPSQFFLYQDNKPLAAFSDFYADQNLPLRVTLMIDASDSMARGFAAERKAAEGFLGRVVRPQTDSSAVVAFSTHSQVETGVDPASPATLRHLEKLRSAGLTSLFDSICDAVGLFPATEQAPVRRVLVLLSDGDDNYSRHSLGEAVEAALGSDVVIYAITPHNPKQEHWGDDNLVALTNATGGRVFFLKNYEQSEKAFAEIEQEIRARYTATFRPTGSTCGFHSLRIEPTDISLRIRSRTGFYGDCR